MKDFFTEFHKTNSKRHAAIAVFAFAFAVGVNAFLFSTPTGVRLQTSAIEYAGGAKTTVGPDIVLSSAGTGTDVFKLKFAKSATNVQEIQASVLFDPKSVEIVSVNALSASAELAKVSNIEGIVFFTLRFAAPISLKADTELISLQLKKSEKGSTPINLASTRMIADGSAYDLTNQGTEY